MSRALAQKLSFGVRLEQFRAHLADNPVHQAALADLGVARGKGIDVAAPLLHGGELDFSVLAHDDFYHARVEGLALIVVGVELFDVAHVSVLLGNDERMAKGDSARRGQPVDDVHRQGLRSRLRAHRGRRRRSRAQYAGQRTYLC